MLLPYLELPVAIGYAGQDDKIVKGMFQVVKVSHYHEGFYDVGMFIYIDGQPVQIALTIAEYEAKILAYWNELAKQTNAQNEKKNIKHNF